MSAQYFLHIYCLRSLLIACDSQVPACQPRNFHVLLECGSLAFSRFLALLCAPSHLSLTRSYTNKRCARAPAILTPERCPRPWMVKPACIDAHMDSHITLTCGPPCPQSFTALIRVNGCSCIHVLASRSFCASGELLLGSGGADGGAAAAEVLTRY